MATGVPGHWRTSEPTEASSAVASGAGKPVTPLRSHRTALKSSASACRMLRWACSATSSSGPATTTMPVLSSGHTSTRASSSSPSPPAAAVGRGGSLADTVRPFCPHSPGRPASRGPEPRPHLERYAGARERGRGHGCSDSASTAPVTTSWAARSPAGWSVRAPASTPPCRQAPRACRSPAGRPCPHGQPMCGGGTGKQVPMEVVRPLPMVYRPRPLSPTDHVLMENSSGSVASVRGPGSTGSIQPSPHARVGLRPTSPDGAHRGVGPSRHESAARHRSPRHSTPPPRHPGAA